MRTRNRFNPALCFGLVMVLCLLTTAAFAGGGGGGYPGPLPAVTLTPNQSTVDRNGVAHVSATLTVTPPEEGLFRMFVWGWDLGQIRKGGGLSRDGSYLGIEGLELYGPTQVPLTGDFVSVFGYQAGPANLELAIEFQRWINYEWGGQWEWVGYVEVGAAVNLRRTR